MFSREKPSPSHAFGVGPSLSRSAGEGIKVIGLPNVTSHHRDIGGVDGLHADDVVAAIDMMHLAGNPGRQIA